ncbi:MAG: hypothetical protein QG597_3877 [Actinomycetota bacterium]|nr:hypothetical protein [Actinomycetota bacterium]
MLEARSPAVAARSMAMVEPLISAASSSHSSARAFATSAGAPAAGPLLGLVRSAHSDGDSGAGRSHMVGVAGLEDAVLPGPAGGRLDCEPDLAGAR